MVVCKFWKEGRCNRGDSCNFEHPGNNRQQGNRFAPLSTAGGGGGFGSRGRSNAGDENKYGISQELVRDDLTFATSEATKTGGRPVYPFSCYGPGNNAPKQLIEGPFEQSPEEMRLQYYLAQANGQVGQYVSQETQLVNEVNNKIQQILSNTADAVKYAVDISPPNRNHLVIKPSYEWPYRIGTASATGGFGQPAQSSGGFGQPSQDSSGFGQPSQNTGGFGQPSQAGSAFGAPSRPGFGAASALGASRPAFGSSSMTGGSAFGQPSQPSGGSAFGQPSQPAASTGFGAPSSLGAKPSPFGGAQQSTPSSGFGAPSAIGAKPSPFGTAAQSASPFGQPSQSATASGFGAKSQPGFGQSGFGSTPQNQNSSPFGAPTATSTGGFGAQSTLQTQPGSAFGQPSAFGTSNPSPFAAAATSNTGNNGFGSTSTQQTPSPFGAPSQPQSSLNRPNPFAASTAPSTGTFGAPTQPSAFGAPRPNNPFSQPSSNNSLPTGTPTTWKGSRVHMVEKNKETFPCYETSDRLNPGKKVLERIWFPNGGPTQPAPFTEAADPSVYEDPKLGVQLEEIYEEVKRTGKFKGGIMPEIPPRREWVGWDL